ncbi:hypothetical protein ACMWP0_07560 [Helicobacter pylori]|uniref:hypothetical protein n=1 Tax=Helicobacter pylori TaxID=210 RepID=UPI0039E1FDFF
MCYQSNQYKTAERALASIQAVLHLLFADKQTQTSEAWIKSASQFESVGVSRRWFCVSKIKQDSANLALAQETTKTKIPRYVARHVRCFYYMF